MVKFDLLHKYDYIYYMDLSWVFHRSFHSYQGFTAEVDGMVRPTGHIYGTLRAVHMLLSTYPNTAVVVCVDGVPVSRKDMAGGYKASREKPSYPFMKDISPTLDMLLLIPNVYIAFHPTLESDDLMFALSQKLTRHNAQAFIYSGDDDLLQGIRENICVVREINKGVPTRIDRDYVVNDKRMVEKFHGTEPINLPTYRSIIGDHSDELPGVPRFPRDVAVKLSKYSGYDEIMEKVNFSTPKGLQIKQKLQEYEQRIKLNDKMMRLKTFGQLDPHIQETIQVVTSGFMDIRYGYCLVDIFNLASMKKYLPASWVTNKTHAGAIVMNSCNRWLPLTRINTPKGVRN